MTVRILVGDCRVRLREFPNNFFHACVLSWPYLGQRDYGIRATIWGGDPECTHAWDAYTTPPQHGDDGITSSTLQGGKTTQSISQRTPVSGAFCQLCGAWLGNFGLEPQPELYVQHGVEISREVGRVLRDDGSMWVNLGDTHWGGKGQSAYAWSTEHQDRPTLQKSQHQITGRGQTRPQDYQHPTIKPKDLVGIPWACAFALRDDGWYLRQAIPWVKDNPMPESMDDRPTTSHEYLFLLSKGKHYYYDKVAIFEPTKEVSVARAQRRVNLIEREGFGAGGKQQKSLEEGAGYDHAYAGLADGRSGGGCDSSGRNRRTADWWYDSLDLLIEQQHAYLVHLEHIKAEGGMLLDRDGEPLALKVNPEGFSGDHYATFPARLVEPCVKASTSERGACPDCGGPWERVVEVSGGSIGKSWHNHEDDLGKGQRAKVPESKGGHGYSRKTIGWRPTCDCYGTPPLPKLPKQRKKESDEEYAERTAPIQAERLRLLEEWKALPAVPCVVLDPMGGAGTTAMVADRLGRDAVSIDIKPEYGQMSHDRIVKDAGPLFNPQVTLEV